jgi:hypothetical protein
MTSQIVQGKRWSICPSSSSFHGRARGPTMYTLTLLYLLYTMTPSLIPWRETI